MSQPFSDDDAASNNSVAATSPLYEADLALSEAGSLTELRAARASFTGNEELQRRFGAAADALLDHRMLERAMQLKQQDRQRVQNMLSTAPFHALNNATSPVLVEPGSHHMSPNEGSAAAGRRRTSLHIDLARGNSSEPAGCPAAVPIAGATPPLPFDGREWAAYLEQLAPLLKPFGTHLEGHTNGLARTLRTAIAATADEQDTRTARRLMQQRRGASPPPSGGSSSASPSTSLPPFFGGLPIAPEGFYNASKRRYVAIVGRRGVGRGAVFQALTSAGAVTATEAVGSKMLPIALRHDDSVVIPYMPAYQVQRVWVPLRAAIDNLSKGTASPMGSSLSAASRSSTVPATTSAKTQTPLDALFAEDPAVERLYRQLAEADPMKAIADETGAVEGAQLVALIRFAHAALRCLATVNTADALLSDIFWPSEVVKPASGAGSRHDPVYDGPSSGPPEIRCRFPWLRGCAISLTLLDVPMPDDASAFMTQTVELLLQQSITTIVVDEAIPSAAGGGGGGAAAASNTSMNASMVSTEPPDLASIASPASNMAPSPLTRPTSGGQGQPPQWPQPVPQQQASNPSLRVPQPSQRGGAQASGASSVTANSCSINTAYVPYVDPQRNLQWTPTVPPAKVNAAGAAPSSSTVNNNSTAAASPASAASRSGAAEAASQDALWQLLRRYSKARLEEQVLAARVTYDELAVWDADTPPAAILALTLPTTLPAQEIAKLDFAQLAVQCHVRLRHQYQLSINVTNMFVVAPVAAGAVVRLFDLVRDLLQDDESEPSPTLPVVPKPPLGAKNNLVPARPHAA
jgi:hypothetical protein